ncbi:hypothetical protein BH24ACT4_BH24ACT4_23170 [soil metagenome]
MTTINPSPSRQSATREATYLDPAGVRYELELDGVDR